MASYRSTKLKVTIGYTLLLAILLFSLVFVHREMETLSAADDQENLRTDSLLTLLERKLQELRVTRELQQADIATFEQEMSQLSQEYDKRMKLLDYYADKFARINKDELSAMERQAMALVEKGDIDGAIHIYEASGIVEQFSNKMAQRDSLQQSLQTTRRLIKQQLEWYEKEGGSVSQEKAIQLKQALQQLEEKYKLMNRK